MNPPADRTDTAAWLAALADADDAAYDNAVAAMADPTLTADHLITA